FKDDYFQEIINPDFEKIDSPFQQTSSLKPYVLNVILEKIIIDLEDEVVNHLEKEKVNLETIKSLKSKGFESSETAISESENQSENDCLVVENECDKEENSKVIAPGMFKLSVSQSVSQISMSKILCDSKNVDSKLKRKRPVSHSKLNKNVKRYSRKDLLACNNSHLGETSSAYVCIDAMNVFCNPRMCDLLDDNNLFIFDDESIIHICLWVIESGCSKHMTGNRALLTNFVEKFLGTVRFGNNDFAVIAGYGDVVIDGVDLLTGDCSLNLYTVALNEVASNSLATLLAKASSSQSWLWHQQNPSESQLQVQRIRTDNGTEFKNQTLAKFFDEVGITQQFSAARTPQKMVSWKGGIEP
nr:hypothetical protein [Tanacetum cinerariifolium]